MEAGAKRWGSQGWGSRAKSRGLRARSVESGLGSWSWVRVRVSSVGSQNWELEFEVQGLWEQVQGFQSLGVSRAQSLGSSSFRPQGLGY